MKALATLLLAAAVGSVPVVSLGPDQVLAAVNRSWIASGEVAFVRHGEVGPLGIIACSGKQLCISQDVERGAVSKITLTGDVGTQAASARYLKAQAMLVGLTSPGAPSRPAVTADRLAVTDGQPASAQLGPTCMRVAPVGGRLLNSLFSRSPCP